MAALVENVFGSRICKLRRTKRRCHPLSELTRERQKPISFACDFIVTRDVDFSLQCNDNLAFENY